MSRLIKIYTDGSSIGNPGPGGYGIVMLSDNQDYKKAYDIVKPAQRDGGLVVNIKGDYSYNRSLGTLTDNFFQLFLHEHGFHYLQEI